VVSFSDRVRSAYNAFIGSMQDQEAPGPASFGSSVYGASVSTNGSRIRLRVANERSIISSIYTRMSIDISSVDIRHTRHDENDRYLEDIASGLNDCLTVEANMDQAASSFRQDIVLKMFDKGVAVVVPVDTTIDPKVSGSYDIKSMRVGEVTQWFPYHVRVNLYNERTGQFQEITLPKANVGIIENPLYSVMNEPNSTLQRLIRKLSLLDKVDEDTSSGKLDLIIQLPYVIKSEARKQQAEQRRQDIEYQLKGSQYGIAYTDGTEKITQLNRPAENNLLGQIQDLKTQLYAELGLTPTVMDGTADEKTMLNYNNRTVEPILRAISEEMKRKFLTKTARTQGQSIDYFRDPFKLVPMSDLAEMADKLSRNEIVTANEFRQFIGLKPSSDPKADQLINSNMPVDKTGVGIADPTAVAPAMTPEAPAVETPTDTSSLDAVHDAIQSAYTNFGIQPPSTSVTPAPPGLGVLAPDVVLSSLDEIDASIDETFNGLGG
jgi:hypothetical protein